MTLSDDAIKILEENKTTPLDAYDKVTDLLSSECEEGGRCDPLGLEESAKEGRQAYHAAHNWFMDKKLYPADEKMLIEWWNKLGLMQFSSEQHVYCAETAFLLSELYRKSGDMGAAFRWALHMQADDILGDHPERGGAGKQTLIPRYGMSTPAFDEFNHIAEECLKEISETDNWSRVAAFPEEVICRFATSKAGHSLAEFIPSHELPVSLGYFNALLNSVENENEETQGKKGRALENLAFYLILLIPGCVPRKNVLMEKRIFESDVVVHNLSQSPSLTTELLGRHFLIECKSSKKEKMGVSEIGYFLYKMRLTHTKFGILFTRRGITGKERLEAGFDLIRLAYNRDGRVCVVVDNKDLEGIKSGKEIYFWMMLLRKIEEMRFGRSSDRSRP